MAALLHLFFMAAFAWMLVEGLLLWSKVVAVNLSEDRHMKYYYLIGWGRSFVLFILSFCLTKSADVNLHVDNNSYSLPIFSVLLLPSLPLSLSPGLPVLIVTITLSSSSGKYTAEGYCWLSVQNGVIWGFTGPVIFIIMVGRSFLI